MRLGARPADSFHDGAETDPAAEVNTDRGRGELNRRRRPGKKITHKRGVKKKEIDVEKFPFNERIFRKMGLPDRGRGEKSG